MREWIKWTALTSPKGHGVKGAPKITWERITLSLNRSSTFLKLIFNLSSYDTSSFSFLHFLIFFLLSSSAKCKSVLGMQTFIIKNEQISASSAWNNNRQQYGSSRARLHLDTWPPGWRAQKNDLSPWLQIDLVQVHIVTALATQGYGDEKEREWVKTYLLTTSRDGQKWISYKERRRKRVISKSITL